MDDTTLIGGKTVDTRRRGRRLRASLAGLVAAAALAGCAGTGQGDGSALDRVNDPLEPANRVIFAANQAVDTVVLRPVAVTYGTWVPEPIQYNVRSFLRNLRSPLIIANELLQGDWEGAERATARFFVNTIAGAGGIVDIAGDNLGIPFEPEDFGQTLAVWGVDSGPYIVLPLFGPSTLRDATGLGVEMVADPVTNQLDWGLLDETPMEYVRPGLTAADTRYRTLEATDELEASSLDYYAAVRSFYLQDRARQITDGASQEGGSDFEIPDYDETGDTASRPERTAVGVAEVPGARASVTGIVLDLPALEPGSAEASAAEPPAADTASPAEPQTAALPTLVLDIEPAAY
ncbi:MAG: VacJ family lipoprotein [Azospirillaceae bacterium]